MTLQTVLTDALTLPGDERAQLVGHLIESLDEMEEELDEAAWEQMWVGELNRRIADLEAGRTATVPAETVFAKLREHLDLDADAG